MRRQIPRWQKILAGGTLVVAALFYSAHLAFYALTLARYERLVAAKPATREQVQTLLAGFRETQVSRREEMDPLFRDKLSAGADYRRYVKYPGFPIDVVYDQAGRIDRIWPKFD